MSFLDNIYSRAAGLEDNDLGTPVALTVEAQADVVADAQLAVVEKEQIEQAQEIAENDKAIEVLEEKLEVLEDQIETVQDALSGTESLNGGKIQYILQQASKITAKFGHSFEVEGVEAFATATSADMAASAGLESMKETAGKIWTAIKNFFIGLYNAVVNFFKGLRNRFAGIKAKANTLKARVDAAAEDKIKEQIKLGKWNAFLDFENGSFGVDDAKTRSAIISNATDIAKTLSQTTPVSKTDVGNARRWLDALLKNTSDKKEAAAPSDTKRISGKIGGIEFTAVVPSQSVEDGEKFDKALLASSLSYKATGEGFKTGETKGMAKSALSSTCSSVASAAQELQINKLDEGVLKAQRDRAIGVIEAQSTKETSKEDKAAVKAMRGLHKLGNKINQVCFSYQGDVLVAKLSLVGAHL